MALYRLILATGLLLLFSVSAYSAIELRDEGTSQGYVVVADCVGASVSCARSGITGTITVSASGGGDNNVLTSDIGAVPYYNTRATISEDRTHLWLPSSNTLSISADVGQPGTQLAFAVSSDTGALVANISHDGSARFNKVQLSNDLTVIDGGTGISSGTSGGVPYYSTTTTMASSSLFAANAVVVGGGSGTAPLTITADTGTSHALFATATSPAFRNINSTDVVNVYNPSSYDNGMVVQMGDAATITPNLDLGKTFKVTLGANRILGTPINATNGRSYIFIISQDVTGTRTLTYSPWYRFGTDVTSPTLTTTAGANDMIGVAVNDRGNFISGDVLAVAKGYSAS